MKVSVSAAHAGRRFISVCVLGDNLLVRFDKNRAAMIGDSWPGLLLWSAATALSLTQHGLTRGRGRSARDAHTTNRTLSGMSVRARSRRNYKHFPDLSPLSQSGPG